MPRDIFDQDWPDQRETRERRESFIAEQLARVPAPFDPLVDPYAEARAKRAAEATARFWIDREDRPLADRLGLGGARDRRLQHTDPPLLDRGPLDDDDRS